MKYDDSLRTVESKLIFLYLGKNMGVSGAKCKVLCCQSYLRKQSSYRLPQSWLGTGCLDSSSVDFGVLGETVSCWATCGAGNSEGQHHPVLYEQGHRQEMEVSDYSSQLGVSWTAPRHCILWFGLPNLR